MVIARNPIQQRAYVLVRRGLAKGEVIRPETCSSCGRPPHPPNPVTIDYIEAHHPDYSKPLGIVWLCRTCHRQAHKVKKQARLYQQMGKLTRLSTNTERALPRYRRVLTMREAGVSVAEIAKLIGVGEKMVYLILSKARSPREQGRL